MRVCDIVERFSPRIHAENKAKREKKPSHRNKIVIDKIIATFSVFCEPFFYFWFWTFNKLRFEMNVCRFWWTLYDQCYCINVLENYNVCLWFVLMVRICGTDTSASKKETEEKQAIPNKKNKLTALLDRYTIRKIIYKENVEIYCYWFWNTEESVWFCGSYLFVCLFVSSFLSLSSIDNSGFLRRKNLAKYLFKDHFFATLKSKSQLQHWNFQVK